MRYKLLALDIDGTLLNSKSELTPRTKEAIVRAKERGVIVVLATGRRLAKTLPFVDDLGLSAPVVIHNGAVIYDIASQQTIVQRGIELAIARDIVDKLDSLDINYVVYTGESAGERVVAPIGTWDEEEDLIASYLIESAEFLEHVDLVAPPVRISTIDRVPKIEALFELLSRDYAEAMNALVFETELNVWRGIEIIPANCSKGQGLAEVAARLGVGQGEVVAIGDNDNDIEMIAWAGLGIAMDNGSQLLKEQAKKIAPSYDEDGVAQVIEEFLL